MVVLVVLRAERLEQEVIRSEPEWRLVVVRNEGHLGIVSPVAFVGGIVGARGWATSTHRARPGVGDVSTKINHVSVNARDLQASVEFYVDLLEPVYRAAERREAFDYSAFGNLVEIDCVGVDRLPEELRAQLKHLWDFHPQDDENMRARLYVPE